jgi:hypothetical protein
MLVYALTNCNRQNDQKQRSVRKCIYIGADEALLNENPLFTKNHLFGARIP